MYVRSLEISNLRTFERATVELNVPGAHRGRQEFDNVNLLLGDNGSGKTSVLRAVALAALAPMITSNSGFVPFSLVRRVRGKPAKVASVSAALQLHAQEEHPAEETLGLTLRATSGFVDRVEPVQAEPWAEGMWDERAPGFFVVGYGATRRVEPGGTGGDEARLKSRMLRYARVAGLFEEGVTLTPLSPWLPRLQRARPDLHDEVVALADRLLEPHARLVVAGDEYLFEVGGSTLPFEALSDGYRAYIGWVADLLYHLSGGRGALSAEATQRRPWVQPLLESRGIVLVDEIDLHLHPEWQQRVIPSLARTLPNLQFVFTSHSPLVVGTLWRTNVFVLETEQAAGITVSRIRPSDEECYGLSADQILTSGHFGLASARNEEFAARLTRQVKVAQEGDPEAAIRFMRLMALGGAAVVEPATPSRDEPTAAPPATAPAGAGKIGSRATVRATTTATARKRGTRKVQRRPLKRK
jgi:hypothetical protein